MKKGKCIKLAKRANQSTAEIQEDNEDEDDGEDDDEDDSPDSTTLSSVDPLAADWNFNFQFWPEKYRFSYSVRCC